MITVVLCVPQGVKRLFFICSSSAVFSNWCWRLMHVRWNLGLSALEMLLQARRDFNSVIFREIIIVGAWAIWKHRNEIVFDGVALSLRRWKQIFKDELGLVVIRAKPSLKQVLEPWLSNFH